VVDQPEQWRKKYQEALREAAADEKRWAALEAVLRRVVGRLCIAARGLDEALDAELNETAQAVRKSAPTEELEGLFNRLSAAIAALDDKRAAEARNAAVEAAQITVREAGPAPSEASAAAAMPVPTATLQSINELVAAMIERLDVQAELREKVTVLRDRIIAATTTIDLAVVLREIAEVVNQQRVSLQSEKAAIERVLEQVASRLDEMAAYLSSETESRKEAQDNGRSLNAKLLSEVRIIDADVREATDLSQLQTQVRARLDAISGHLHDFFAREHARHEVYEKRSESMRRRIEELERETCALNLSLAEKHRQATTDVLTGIPNRLAYEQRIELEYLRWKRTPAPLCIAAWDIDRFKAINDTYGHPGGDKVLHVVGQFFIKHLRRTDFIARYGGEEFVMILVGATIDQALKVADGLRQSVESLGFHYHGKPVTITVSCGVADFRDGDKPDAVFARADKALYFAKQQGRNCCMPG
jgi:diguanylate cyclase